MILRGYHLLRTVPAGCVAFIMFYSRIENDFVFFPDRELGLQPSDGRPQAPGARHGVRARAVFQGPGLFESPRLSCPRFFSADRDAVSFCL